MKRPNLILHCGAHEVPRKELAKVELPPTTETYHPIGHDTLVDLVEDKLADVGFRFGAQAHSLTKNGDRYFGLVQLLNGSSDEDEYALVAGLRNSLDKKFPAALAFGSQVFVCDNLAFSGEIKISRKHTSRIMHDLPGLVASAVSQTTFMQESQSIRFEHYKKSKIDTRTADHLIIEMVRREVINTVRVQRIVQAWDAPEHDFGPMTAWRLFNAATESLKGSPLGDMPGKTIELQAILDAQTGFVPRQPEPIEGEVTVVE